MSLRVLKREWGSFVSWCLIFILIMPPHTLLQVSPTSVENLDLKNQSQINDLVQPDRHEFHLLPASPPVAYFMATWWGYGCLLYINSRYLHMYNFSLQLAASPCVRFAKSRADDSTITCFYFSGYLECPVFHRASHVKVSGDGCWKCRTLIDFESYPNIFFTAILVSLSLTGIYRFKTTASSCLSFCKCGTPYEAH